MGFVRTSLFGSVLLNFFTNDSNKYLGSVDTLNGRDALHQDFDPLEGSNHFHEEEQELGSVARMYIETELPQTGK